MSNRVTRRGAALTCLLLTALVLTASSGCGVKQSEVSGTVTYDGQNVSEGEIIFEAADGKIAPGAGAIKDGRYTVLVPPGSKKVRINASRPSAKIDPVMKAAPMESYIPKQYNVDTKLTADVKSGKQDGVNFTLTSKP